MMPRLHLRNWLFYCRAASSSWSSIASQSAPYARFLSTSSNVSDEAEHSDGPGVAKITRQVSKAIKSWKEDMAAERLYSFQSLEPSVVFCNYVLNSCAKAGNSKMAKDVRAYMLEKGVAMNDVSHGCYLRALCRDNQLEEAVSELESLGQGKGAVLPNLVMCNIVLNGCFLSKSKPHADRCLQVISNAGLQRDEMTYVELMKLAGLHKEVSEIWKLWEELVKICEPSPSSRCVLIVALCRARCVTEALVAMKDMSDAVAENRVSTRLPGKRKGPVADLNDAAVGRSNESKAEGVLVKGVRDLVNKVLFKRLKQVDRSLESFEEWEVRKELQDSLNSIINAAGVSGEHLVAEYLFAEMRRLRLKLSIYTYNALLRAVVRGRGVTHGLRIIRSMEATGIKPDTCTYTALLDGYCQEGGLDKAEALLHRMLESSVDQRPSRYTYNILLKACGVMGSTVTPSVLVHVTKSSGSLSKAAAHLLPAQGDPERALRIFAKMKEADVSPDSCTYIALLGACGTVNGSKSRDNRWSRQEVSRRLLAIEADMARSGVQHTTESISALLKALGDEGMLEVLMQRLRAFSGRDNSFSSYLLDATSYNTAMHGCVKAQQFDAAWDIFDEMKSLGITPNCETFNILIDACSYKKSLSEAFGLVDAMHREGIQPDIVTYNSLIKVTCHAGELDVSLEILCKMRSHGVSPNVQTYNTILSSAAYHSRLDLTEFLIEDMRSGGITPDSSSCLHIVGAYIKCGQDENAAEALRVVSSWMLPQDAKIHTPGTDAAGSDTAYVDWDREFPEHIPLQDPADQALFISRLAELAHGGDSSWTPQASPWASRIRQQYQGKS